jgi:hypothetical protein
MDEYFFYPKMTSAPETGTLQELNVKAGDVVECVWPDGRTYTHTISEFKDGRFWSNTTGGWLGNMVPWRIISRASDTPKLWRDMTDAEKGALLLAHHEGKVIDVFSDGEWTAPINMIWYDWNAYRVRPEPVREVRNLYIYAKDTDYALTKVGTIETEDGKPDCATIKMEEL